MTTYARSDASLPVALRLIDDAWEEVRRSLFVRQAMGAPLSSLPHVSLEECERRSAVGKALLARVDAIDPTGLPHDIALSLRLLRYRANTWAREADWYWNVVDPLGVGFFGMFLPTAYCGGFFFNFIHTQLASFQFKEAGDCDRYLGLVADYARLIDQFTARTEGQAERGIRMPKVQLTQARALLTAFRSRARTTGAVAEARLRRIDGAAFRGEVDRRLAHQIEPAFDRALAGIGDDYASKAPDTVGLGQYAGGREIYAELVKVHTTLDLTPEEVHARGFRRMEEIEASMRAIRDELGFKGDGLAFVRDLNADPRWRAGTVEGVTEVFERYIERLKPRFAEYFATAPQATHGVAPLPEALQASMTFGYYEPARPETRQGTFFFNSGNLVKQSLFNIGALTYHELVPGHHLHLATQQENQVLHPFRKHSFVNAYNEGWAEYAATFAGEIGMYEAPEERYGRLVGDAFLTCRLVVDTGMNVLGWSLEQARDYMRAHGGTAEAEVLTESVRYSCDIPGQALAYKLGDTAIFELRKRMREGLGARFSLRDFHDAILGPGALPIPDLEWHVGREIERLRGSNAAVNETR
jgi:uncharacterized protein (DUF885 family)